MNQHTPCPGRSHSIMGLLRQIIIRSTQCLPGICPGVEEGMLCNTSKCQEEGEKEGEREGEPVTTWAILHMPLQVTQSNPIPFLNHGQGGREMVKQSNTPNSH